MEVIRVNNHIFHLLNEWFPNRDKFRWVLGTVYATQGSSYRKAGSHMLFNDFGGKLGLLSGGCLESDLHRKANQALLENQAIKVRYDTSDEQDIDSKMGLGCGGIVDILLQPLHKENDYLHLEEVFHSLKANSAVIYKQKIPSAHKGNVATAFVEQSWFDFSDVKKATIEINNQEHWLISHFVPLPQLLVIGGGIDARPLVSMASQLGWETMVVDPRPANARVENFPDATNIEKCKPDEISTMSWLQHINAAVIMSHNVELDAGGLKALAHHPLSYCALLGPNHRQEQVLKKANLLKADLLFKLAGPAGLDLGAELPESIALSILAECHAAIFNGSAKSLSHIL